MDDPFLGIASVFLIFWYLFSDSINFFQRTFMFPNSKLQTLAVWMVSECVAQGMGVWDLGM